MFIIASLFFFNSETLGGLQCHIQIIRMKLLPLAGKKSTSNRYVTKLKSSIEKRRTVNYIFHAIVLCTLGISSRISRKLKRQYAGRARLSSHRSKTFAIIAIEVLIWIGFNVFWQFSRSNWVPICIVGIVMIGMILSRKKKRYA